MRNGFSFAGLILLAGIGGCSKPQEKEEEPVLPVQVHEPLLERAREAHPVVELEFIGVRELLGDGWRGGLFFFHTNPHATRLAVRSARPYARSTMTLENCQQCHGTGWKLVARPDGPGKFAVACDCGSGERAVLTMNRARIPKRYEHCELSNFEFDGPHARLMQARMAACKFVEEYPLENSGLLLIGSIGVGKTHLAVGIIKELVGSKGIPFRSHYRDCQPICGYDL